MTDPPPVPVPEPVPEVPAGKMWTALAAPPLATVLGSLIATRPSQPDLVIVVPLIVIPIIIGFSFAFYAAVSRRYRGRSLVFLMLSYLLGQPIICLVLWFGSCVLFAL